MAVSAQMVGHPLLLRLPEVTAAASDASALELGDGLAVWPVLRDLSAASACWWNLTSRDASPLEDGIAAGVSSAGSSAAGRAL